jgi:hypothetical protein
MVWAPARLRLCAAWLLLANVPLMLLGTPERMAEFAAPAVVTLAAVALARLPAGAGVAILAANTAIVLNQAIGSLPLLPPVVLGLVLVAAGALSLGRPRLAWLLHALGVAGGVAIIALWATRGAPRGGFAPIEVPPEMLPLPRIDLQVAQAQRGLGPDGSPVLLGVVENRGRQTAWEPRVHGDGVVFARSIPPRARAPVLLRTGHATGLGVVATTDEPVAEHVPVPLQPVQVAVDADGVVRGRLANGSVGPLRDLQVAVLALDLAGLPVAVAVGSAELDDGRIRPGTSEPFAARLPAGTAAAEILVVADGLPDVP